MEQIVNDISPRKLGIIESACVYYNEHNKAPSENDEEAYKGWLRDKMQYVKAELEMKLEKQGVLLE